jgi:type II secretory pathway component PulK
MVGGYTMVTSRKESGAILIIALWILAILVALSLGFAYRTRLRLKQSTLKVDKLTSYNYARAGINRALVEIAHDTTSYDALIDTWANNPEIYRRFKLADGGFSIYNTSNRDDFSEEKFGVVDEESKININIASLKTLANLPYFTRDIAASIIDWRDRNQIQLPGGAEDSYYQSLPNPYSCKDSTIESIDELLLIKGITSDLLLKIEDFATVYGEGKVNINTCSKEILRALGLSAFIVDKIVGYRSGLDRIEGTYDDNVFGNPSQIVESLSNYVSLTSEEISQITSLTARNQITVFSQYFRINSKGWLQKKRAVTYITAIVKRDNENNLEVVYWREI